MSDDKTIRGPQDSLRINLNEDYEIQYWTGKFNCSRQELIEAVDAVGTVAKRVEEYLKK